MPVRKKSTAPFDFQKAQIKYVGDSIKVLNVECKMEDVDFKNAKALFQALMRNPELAPKIKGVKSVEDYIHKWVIKYKKGYANRISQSIGKKMRTHHDTALDVLVEGMFELTEKEKKQFIEAHRFVMSIENKLGAFLEEYLAIKLFKYGYYCAWGSTLDKVDFYSKKRGLLQIKNSSNSENSSSITVRDGKDIFKWHRRVAEKQETFLWSALNKKLGIKPQDELTEEGFRKFISSATKKNKQIIYSQPQSSWKKKR